MRQPPDIEMILTGLLRAELPAGVYVGRKAPTTRQERMVTVRRQGGTSRRHIDRPRVGINVWDVTPQAANALAAQVIGVLNDLAGRGDNPIKKASIYGLIEVPEDTELHQRYVTADLSVRTI